MVVIVKFSVRNMKVLTEYEARNARSRACRTKGEPERMMARLEARQSSGDCCRRAGEATTEEIERAAKRKPEANLKGSFPRSSGH
jgi:hypothetical protein